MNNAITPPLVSIITVNYNTTNVTLELLYSLSNISYTNIEIIVVDNASTQNCDSIPQQFKNITFIRNPTNQGFAGGNNRGIEIAKGEICLLINNDTEVEPNFLEPIVNLFQKNTNIGIVSAKLLYYNAKNVIQYAGGTPINPFTARGKFIGTGETDTNKYCVEKKTYLAHGAAMAIHKKVFNKIGLLPEMYFLYYEELDFCEHAQKAGFEIWFQPKSVVYHKESMSVGKLSNLKVYYQTRNRLLFIRRNIFGFKGFISRIFYIFVSIPIAIIRYLLANQKQYVIMVLKGLVWNFNYKNQHNL